MTNYDDARVSVRDTTADHPLTKYISGLSSSRPEEMLDTGKLWLDLAILQQIVNFSLQQMDLPASSSAVKAYIDSPQPGDLALVRGEELLSRAAESLRDGRANFHLGMLCQQRGNLGESLRQFSEAASRSPGAARAQYQAGMLLLDRGLKNEAIQFFASAIVMTANFGEARRVLATLRRSESPIDGARHFAALMQYDPALDYDNRVLTTRDDGLEFIAGAYNGYDIFRVEGTYYAVPIQIRNITAAFLKNARPRLLHRRFFVNQINRLNVPGETPRNLPRTPTETPMPGTLHQLYSTSRRTIASVTQNLIIGRRRLKRFIIRVLRRAARSRRYAPAFLRPAVEMLERLWTSWMVKRRIFAAMTLPDVTSEIDLRTSAIHVVAENYRGYNFVRWRGWLFAVPQKHGRVGPRDLHWAYLLRLQRRRSGAIIVERTHADLRRVLDNAHGGPGFTQRTSS